MEFEEYQLKEICSYSNERINVEEVNINDYVSTENLLPEKKGKAIASGLPNAKTVIKYTIGDTLISNIRPYFKKIWHSNAESGASADVLVFKPNFEKVDSKYLYYFLSQNEIFEYMVQTSKGTKMPRGDKSALMNYVVNLPGMKQQIKVAELLSDFDEKITINEDMINNLEQLAQTLFKRWFVDFEFPNENGEPYKSSGGEMMESELGMIPMGWEVIELKDLCDANKGNFSKKDNWLFINYLDTSNITNNSIADFRFIDTEIDKVPSRAKRKVHTNDIIYSTVRPNQNHHGIIKEPIENMIVSTGFTVLRAKGDYSNDMIYLWLTQQEMLDRLQSIAEQSTSTYPSIKADDILTMKILNPSMNELKILTGIAEKQNNIIWSLQQENKKLIELRDTLLPKLLSGEIEIPDETEVMDDVPI